jgi:WD40 repeat protein
MGLTLKKFKDVTDVGLNCLRLLKNGNMACGSLYKKISILNLDTGKNIQVLRGHTAEIWDLQIPLNNKTNELISCSEDKRIKFWNLETGECFKTLVSSNLDTIFSQYQVLIWVSTQDRYLSQLNGTRLAQKQCNSLFF